MLKKLFTIFNIVCISLTLLSCGDQIADPEATTNHKMYVYSNIGQTFYLVDYTTFDVVQKITLDLPETISYLGGMQLSTTRDYLVFGAQGHYPDNFFGFVLYNIQRERPSNVFVTSIPGGGYFIAAQNDAHPGLFYVHFRDLGTYAIDVFDQQVKEFITDEHAFSLSKRIYHSPDMQWTIVKKNWEATGYTELEFYTHNSGLHDLQFVLNKENSDSLRIYDFVVTHDQALFFTYLPGPTRDTAAGFGCYNLNTQELVRTTLRMPWSLNPYYTAYSPIRDEVYTVGAYDTLYVIEPHAGQFAAKIPLPGKVLGPSRTLLSPDEEMAFVSCSNTDAIYVIDLDKKTVVHVIEVVHPYNMIIP